MEKKQKIPKLPSPCEGICIMDSITGYCKGCMRTLAEISDWKTMDNDERLKVVQALRERRIAAGRIGRMDKRRRSRMRSRKSA